MGVISVSHNGYVATGAYYFDEILIDWACPHGFVSHRHGITPKEHYDMIDRAIWEKRQEQVATSNRTSAFWAIGASIIAAFFGIIGPLLSAYYAWYLSKH